LLDSGADDTVFPLHVAHLIEITTRGIGQQLRWRGQTYPLQFGSVELELVDRSGSRWRWPTTIGFSSAPIRYPILGNLGCLQFFDAMFRGDDRIVELETNRAYSGIKA
jgi:hypothetical protein